VQDLEGDLGLVLGVDGEFTDGLAEMSERLAGRATGDALLSRDMVGRVTECLP
jgi:hypothetical protein